MVQSSAHFDVVIVGGGPAGSTAGYILSRAGLKVVIIDKSRFPRKKLCGGLITDKTILLLERIFGDTVDSLKDQNIIQSESNHYDVRNKKTLIARRDITIPLRFINRDTYDHYLLKRAHQAGAALVEGDRVKEIDVLKKSVLTQSGWRFSSDIIIGADGANSRIRRSFPVNLFGRDDWKENLAAAFEITIEQSRVKKQAAHPVLYFGFVEHGYAWIFPAGDQYKIGMCALKNRNRKKIISAFHDFLASLNISVKNEKVSAYVLPYGNYLPEPVYRNIVLVGDAAGFVDPLLGEGIFYAQRSAELAAGALLKAVDEDDVQKSMKEHYLQSLKTHIYTELVYAEKIRNTIFRYLRRFQWYPLRILMDLYGDKPIEAVQGLRSYKWMKTITGE